MSLELQPNDYKDISHQVQGHVCVHRGPGVRKGNNKEWSKEWDDEGIENEVKKKKKETTMTLVYKL